MGGKANTSSGFALLNHLPLKEKALEHHTRLVTLGTLSSRRGLMGGKVLLIRI